jgi:hypothetical protein
LFCGLFGTAFSYTKWLPFNLKALILNFPVKSADPEGAPTQSHPVSSVPIRALRSLRCRASTDVKGERERLRGREQGKRERGGREREREKEREGKRERAGAGER